MIRAFGGLLIVLVVPGLLVARLLHRRFDELLTWAAIPVFSLASVFLLGELTMLVKAPFNALTFALLLVALGIGVGVDALLRRGRSPADSNEDPASHKSRQWDPADYALLGLAFVVGLFTWWQGLRGGSPVPPGADGENEGFLVARVVHAHSIAPSKIFVSDADGLHQVFKFFPLGQHASAAISSTIGGASIATVLVAMTVLLAAVVLPLGMFVLARFLAPDLSLVAGLTALTVPCIALLSYTIYSGGDTEIIAAMAIVPVTVVLSVRAIVPSEVESGRVNGVIRERSELVVAALALVALVCVHTSEVVFVVFLVLLLLAERLRRGNDVVTAMVRAAMMSLLAILLYAPSLAVLVQGTSERASVAPFRSSARWYTNIVPELFLETRPVTTLAASGGTFHVVGATHAQVGLALLALAGAAITFWLRKPAWAIGWGTTLILGLFASTSNNWLVAHLTLPWYRMSRRLNAYQVFFVPFLAAVTLALVIGAISRVTRGKVTEGRSAIVVILVFLAVVAVPGYRTTRSTLHALTTVDPRNLFNQSRIDENSQAAFHWLASQVRPGDTVVNEPGVNGSLWLYADDNVPVLLGLKPLETPPRDFTDREFLLTNVAKYGSNARVDELVRRYRAKWIYYDGGTYTLAKHMIDITGLRRNPRIVERFRQGNAYVFAVT